MKKTVIISCPIDTYSGYGARSRDFVEAFIESFELKYDISILAQSWGTTSWGYIKDNPDWEYLESYILKESPKKQPDVFIQITVPNEFQPYGKFNVGITAGSETDMVHHEWLLGANRMDMVLVSSEHSLNSFKNSRYKKVDSKTNKEEEGALTLETEMYVLFEGLETMTYFKNPSDKFDLSSVKEDFNFLFVGHWLPGNYGEDRKNIWLTVRSFLDTFKNMDSPPGLIMKTSIGNESYINREEIKKRISLVKREFKGHKLPNIYLINGNLEEDEMNLLYNHPKVKALINFTKGEGFGRPILEFAPTDKPILVSNWGGHLDFIKKHGILINGNLTPIHHSTQNNLLPKESNWFSVDYYKVKETMSNVFENYNTYLKKAKGQGNYVKYNFSMREMEKKMRQYFKNKI